MDNNNEQSIVTKTLVILRGLPGAGKSLLAKIISKNIASANDFFTDADGNYNFDATKLNDAHGDCYNRVVEFMDAGEDVIVVDNTATRSWEMDDYIELAQSRGYIIHTVIVENRHGSKNIHDVPEEKMKQMADRFEVVL